MNNTPHIEVAQKHREKYNSVLAVLNDAKKLEKETLTAAIEASKPQWTLEVVEVLAEFNALATFKPNRDAGHITEKDREDIFRFAEHGISAQDIAAKFGVSISTVYRYGAFDNAPWSWPDDLRFGEYRFKRNMGYRLRNA